MPTYDYFCTECKSTWERITSISNRKGPEAEPCPNCDVTGSVEQTIAFTSLGFTDSIRIGMHKSDGQLKEKLQQIHAMTPGSRLDTTSTITKI